MSSTPDVKKDKKSHKKEKKSDKKSHKKSHKKEKKRAREEEEDVKDTSLPVTTPVAEKKKKREKEPRELRHFPLSPIAVPLASDDEQAAIFALLKQAAPKKMLRRGTKEIQKALRKKESGLMIFAGDVEPLDVISHLPVLCEDHEVPYIFVRSKEELGAASSTKRPTSCILIKPSDDYKAEFKAVKKAIKPVIY